MELNFKNKDGLIVRGGVYLYSARLPKQKLSRPAGRLDSIKVHHSLQILIHRKNILRKLGLKNIAKLACFAKEPGMVGEKINKPNANIMSGCNSQGYPKHLYTNDKGMGSIDLLNCRK